MDAVELSAITALVSKGYCKRGDIEKVKSGYPRLTSRVTATIEVTVILKNGISYNIPVTTRIEYTYPVALD